MSFFKLEEDIRNKLNHSATALIMNTVGKEQITSDA